MQLQRLVSHESYRFTRVLERAFKNSTGPTIKFLTEYFNAKTITGELDVKAPKNSNRISKLGSWGASTTHGRWQGNEQR